MSEIFPSSRRLFLGFDGDNYQKKTPSAVPLAANAPSVPSRWRGSQYRFRKLTHKLKIYLMGLSEFNFCIVNFTLEFDHIFHDIPMRIFPNRFKLSFSVLVYRFVCQGTGYISARGTIRAHHEICYTRYMYTRYMSLAPFFFEFIERC